MSYLEYRVTTVPSGFAKILHMNWAIVFLVTAIAVVSCDALFCRRIIFKMGRSTAKAFGVTFLLMFIMAVPIWFWRNMSFLAWVALLLIILVS